MKCLAIVYYDYLTVRRSIEDLRTKVELTVVENSSDNTSIIKPYLRSLVDYELIDGYLEFHENISNNAFEIALEGFIAGNTDDYLLFTDGDVTVCGDFVSEQKNILENCPEVAFVSVRLDQSNLPTEAFPESVTWIPPVISEHPLYIEQYSGHQLVMMRRKEFEEYNSFRIEKGWSWTDGSMRQWAYGNGRRWAVTRNSTAYHITWDLYRDRSHPYTQLKLSQSQSNTWDHLKTSGYTRYTLHETTECPAPHNFRRSGTS